LWPAMQQSLAPAHSSMSSQIEPVQRSPTGQHSEEPATKAEQVPAADWPPAAGLHAWQIPLHAVLQQTLSTQWPVLHWEFAVHEAPRGRLTLMEPVCAALIGASPVLEPFRFTELP